MKKILFVLLLLACMPVAQANDLTVVYADTVSGADTNGVRTDTIYTPSMDLRNFNRVWIQLSLGQYSNLTDTVFASDSYFVAVQYSNDKVNWYGHGLGDSLQKILKGANDTTMEMAVGIKRDSSYIGNHFRVRFLHRNTLANQYALNGNIYTKLLTAWISTSP